MRRIGRYREQNQGIEARMQVGIGQGFRCPVQTSAILRSPILAQMPYVSDRSLTNVISVRQRVIAGLVVAGGTYRFSGAVPAGQIGHEGLGCVGFKHGIGLKEEGGEVRLGIHIVMPVAVSIFKVILVARPGIRVVQFGVHGFRKVGDEGVADDAYFPGTDSFADTIQCGWIIKEMRIQYVPYTRSGLQLVAWCQVLLLLRAFLLPAAADTTLCAHSLCKSARCRSSSNSVHNNGRRRGPCLLWRRSTQDGESIRSSTVLTGQSGADNYNGTDQDLMMLMMMMTTTTHPRGLLPR
mmetsp:Transcript_39548/g.86802  ORF Transcript_39548/g.86802 Transcript_39548/m.86802 type:complete len:295 (+) Transcript_39548:371-1255(+)